jgi:two-component sensor histidine kinase
MTATNAPVVQGKAKPSGSRWKFGAADAVVAGSTLLVFAIVGVFVLLCIQGYSQTIEGAKEKAQRAASVVADGSRWVVNSARSVLENASARYSVNQNADDAIDAFRLSASPLPVEFDFGVYDRSGMLIGDAGGTAPASITDRDYLRPNATGWSLGAQEPGAPGNASFAVAKSLVVDGEPVGSLVVFVKARVLEQFAAPQDLGVDSTISIVRDDGWIIARNPPLESPASISGTDGHRQIQNAETGAYLSDASPIDGVSRIVGFKHVPELGYIAIGSISTEAALGPLWYSIWVVSLLLAPIAIAVLVGSLLTAGLLRRTQRARQSLATALEHNEDLFREIHHRVKNNLQSVNSLLQIHPIPREVRADMSKRIFAMSAVHEHIYRSKAFADVRVKDYLHTLIGSIREGADPRITVVEELDDIVVDKDAAAPLGLILNEVLTNSLKHAFVGRDGGTVWVSLKSAADGLAVLEIRDDGPGFDMSAPSRGIGRRLVEGFAAQLSGQVSHRQEGGYVFALEFPASNPSQHAGE